MTDTTDTKEIPGLGGEVTRDSLETMTERELCIYGRLNYGLQNITPKTPKLELVNMIMDEDSWYVVRNSPGVTGFVGMGNKPTPLREDEVNKIMQRIESDEPRLKVSFELGEHVRITGGPFAEFNGIVDEIDADKGKAKVLVSFFNRETPVEVDFIQLERDVQ